MNSLDLDQTILQIHAAPLEPQGWLRVMRSLMDLCNAENALMLAVGATQLPTIKSWEPSLNFNPAALQDYASHWGSQDLLYLGARDKGGEFVRDWSRRKISWWVSGSIFHLRISTSFASRIIFTVI